ncbi:hypothetical protein M413DRAFT_44499, partial [Hebeloma cylindrosporum]
PDPNNISIPLDPRPPRLTLKDLECIRVLGEGQGQVLLASLKRRSHRLDRRTNFALKVIARKSYRTHAVELCRPDKKFTPEERRSLIKKHMYTKDLERGNLASIPWNPFVAGIFQTFHDSQKLYMALEFIPGLTLRSRLRQIKGGFKHNEANFYFANIICAIEFLHAEGIVHRDIKPDNILLGPDGYLCLTDFGSSAKLSQLDGSWTETGTIYYMAPECQVGARHEPRDIPEAIDWWSSGCVLYEMVTGILPFFHLAALGTQYLVSHAQFGWPLETTRLGKSMRHLVESLLVVAPADRLGANGAEEVQNHPWLSNIDWSKMQDRRYMAPFIPNLPNLPELWHKATLPKSEHVPGITIVEPRLDLTHDDRFP